jgi:hypothetical protein
MHKLQMASRFPTNIKQNKKVYYCELDLQVYIKSIVMVATWPSENSARTAACWYTQVRHTVKTVVLPLTTRHTRTMVKHSYNLGNH